ncbi:MAG TPA: aldo/keto reductase [Candidatus Thermoplasmatota archaeon]|nr:aldo/keto reductase [Candidatus Thermoplasmatota archaeon]
MPRRPFGRTGVDVPVLGLGTWQLRDKERAGEALRVGLDLGLTHVDTAELYTGSEAAIAPVLRGRRDEVFLVSKVLPQNASYDGTLRACDASLRRLGTDHLDAYLLHWRGRSKIDDTMRALETLVDGGKTRFLGVSNFDVEDLEDARKALPNHAVVCDQVLYHLGDRGIEHGLLPWCKKHGVAVVAYSPFGSTGGFPAPGSRKRQVLDDIGKRHGKTARQVTLNFLTRHPSVFAIPKSENPDHVREIAGSVGWELSEKDLEAIDAAFPAGKPRALGLL